MSHWKLCQEFFIGDFFLPQNDLKKKIRLVIKFLRQTFNDGDCLWPRGQYSQ